MMTTPWCCRDCNAALESTTVPDDPICPQCWRTRRIAELTSRRASAFDELEAIEVELARLGGGNG